MRTTIIRLLLVAIFYLLFHFVAQWELDIVWAFVAAYILEPLITKIVSRTKP